MKAAHVIPYMGSKWVRFATGPDEFDCWGLTCDVQSRFFGRELPKIVADGSDPRARLEAFKKWTQPDICELREWEVGDTPSHGSIILMGNLRGIMSHCGVFLEIDGGKVLHTEQNAGCQFTALNRLRYQTFRYYNYISK